jgi:hypothetical protein
MFKVELVISRCHFDAEKVKVRGPARSVTCLEKGAECGAEMVGLPYSN